ncbi:MAG: M6 family metalloprotease domain-containing protein, partial [Prevotella sp.]
MNRFFSTAILICTVSAVMAMPVRRGQWKTVTLADGSTVSVEARGDETMHYWQSADGRCYVRDSHTDRYREVALETLKRNAAAPATRASRTRKMRAQALRRNATQSNRLNGQKRGIVILVDFKGKGFSMANPSNYYSKLFNTKDYYEYGFNGSVHDYFYAQSHGKFDISFDVVGPVTMPHYFAYYGRNDEEKVGEMIHDACVAVDDEVDFSKYDWDGDGEVDMVYVVYAGYGQADYSENDNYIWPHMYILSGYSYYENTLLRLDNTVVDVYACSNEMDYTQNLNGIGTVCHEFSHCLGLPDMYDTAANTNFGMGSWDLMDYGCNNDNGRTPSGYTGYEKMVLGWSTPIELTDPVTVTAMQPASQMGRSYVVYNPARKTEFYVLDNRQPVGFDEALPGHGMLITHVDYDEKIWDNNIVNATGKDPSSGLTNSHQRATIYHADNDDDIKTESSDPYPYHGNDSLTGSSRPAAKWYNVGSDGETRPGFGIFDIKENDDGTMSFNFRAANVPGPGSEVSPTGDDE